MRARLAIGGMLGAISHRPRTRIPFGGSRSMLTASRHTGVLDRMAGVTQPARTATSAPGSTTVTSGVRTGDLAAIVSDHHAPRTSIRCSTVPHAYGPGRVTCRLSAADGRQQRYLRAPFRSARHERPELPIRPARP